MKARHPFRHLASAVRILLPLTIVLGSYQASAAPRDRTPPTTPTDLRVTGTSDYSVSLAWNASSDNSGL